MPYTVTHKDGATKDAEFEAYARLLRATGVDLGHLPRVPEPGTGRRWLYVWGNAQEAKNFAERLNARSTQQPWEVTEVAAPPSEGPMGPLIIQVGRRSNGLVFGLHPLSRTLIQSVFSKAKGVASTVAINFETLHDFKTTHGSIEDLAKEIVPTLTGLSIDQVKQLGYALIEDDTDKTLVFEAPGDMVPT